MKRFSAFWLFLLFFPGVFLSAQAQIPDVPNPPRLVNDFADVLSADQEALLEQKLLAYEDSTSNQVAIVLIKSLDGMDVADYAVQLALKWGIGTKKNNGVLLLAAMEDRKSRIEVGYGLEPVITDAIARRILADDLKPYFKEGQYYQGLDVATTHLIEAARGEFKAPPKMKSLKKKAKGFGIGAIILIILLIVLFSRGGRGGGGGFLTGFLLGQLLGGGHRSRGGWGDFSSGSGSFGGFGGGSFGGGGSSGDW